MGYHCKSGVVIGVLVNSSEVKLGAEAEELLDRMFNEPHEGELYVYRYTPDLDTTTWVIGIPAAQMLDNRDGAGRHACVEPPTYAVSQDLKERIRDLKVLPPGLVELNFGTWFIQGGS